MKRSIRKLQIAFRLCQTHTEGKMAIASGNQWLYSVLFYGFLCLAAALQCLTRWSVWAPTIHYSALRQRGYLVAIPGSCRRNGSSVTLQDFMHRCYPEGVTNPAYTSNQWVRADFYIPVKVKNYYSTCNVTPRGKIVLPNIFGLEFTSRVFSIVWFICIR